MPNFRDRKSVFTNKISMSGRSVVGSVNYLPTIGICRLLVLYILLLLTNFQQRARDFPLQFEYQN